MKRSDDAKAWATVLSGLAQVRVAVEWERADVSGDLAGRPDHGEALMSRAAALGDGVGAPLPFADQRFARSNSVLATALAAWSPESLAAARVTCSGACRTAAHRARHRTALNHNVTPNLAWCGIVRP